MSGQKSTLKPATFLAANEVSEEVYRIAFTIIIK